LKARVNKKAVSLDLAVTTYSTSLFMSVDISCQLCHSLSFANLSVDKIFCGANMLADLLADNKATANGERYTCMFSNLDLN